MNIKSAMERYAEQKAEIHNVSTLMDEMCGKGAI